MKNIKNKKITEFFEKIPGKLMMSVYAIAITVLISYFMSKVYYEQLWPNERTSVVIFMTASIIVPFFYMMFAGKNGVFNLLFYHFILIATALIMMIPYELRPYVAVVMIVVTITDFSTGVVTNAGMCGFAFFSMAKEPDFFFTVITLLVGTVACFVAKKTKTKKGEYLRYVVPAIMVLVCMLLSYAFSIYCADVYEEYSSISYVFKGCAGCVIGAIVYYIFLFVYRKLAVVAVSKKALKEMISDEYKPLRFFKSKSIGVYYHSKEIANLAREGANAIGLDGDLIYVGALYHEIGKLFGKEYVKEGKNFAKSKKFPIEVIDIISNHNPQYGVVHNKECAVVFLATSVVNTMHHLKKNNMHQNMSVRNICESCIFGKIANGNLSESGLSVAEISKIINAFVQKKEAEHDN